MGVETMEAGGAGFLLGIDVGGTKVALATAGADGELLERERIETLAERGVADVLDRILAAARACVARTELRSGGTCAAVGAVAPGIVLDDRVLLSPNLPGWEELALAARLREGLGIEAVGVATDVKAATLAEVRWGALQGVDPGIFLNVGTGIAAGIVIGGRVLSGAHGAAGEIAYNLTGPADVLGARHGRAPLEERVSGRAIGEEGARRLAGAPATAAEVFARAGSGAPDAVALLDELLGELAVHIANLANVVDPERIAVGGGLMRSPAPILAALDERLGWAVPFPPALVAARFSDDAALHGALALALQEADAVRSSDHHAVRGEG